MISKKVLIFLMMAIGFYQAQGWAQATPNCPVLNASYKCEDDSSSLILNFMTLVKDNLYTYSINGRSFMANGTAAADGSSATCSGDSLTVHLQLQLQSGMCSTATGIDSVTEWTLQTDAVLQNDLTTISCAGKPPMNIRKQTLCHKK